MTTASDLPAGRELDFAVHEIMTGERRPYAEHRAGSVPTDWELSCPRYSTDIAAAWTVRDKMQELGFAMRLNQFCTFKDHPLRWHWVCEIATSPVSLVSSEFEPTAELALCRAALKAVGHG